MRSWGETAGAEESLWRYSVGDNRSITPFDTGACSRGMTLLCCERSRRVTVLCLVQIRSAITSSQDRRDTTVETPGGDPTPDWNDSSNEGSHSSMGPAISLSVTSRY